MTDYKILLSYEGAKLIDANLGKSALGTSFFNAPCFDLEDVIYSSEVNIKVKRSTLKAMARAVAAIPFFRKSLEGDLYQGEVLEGLAEMPSVSFLATSDELAFQLRYQNSSFLYLIVVGIEFPEAWVEFVETAH